MNESTRKKLVLGLLIGAIALGWFAKPWERRLPSAVPSSLETLLSGEVGDSGREAGEVGGAAVGASPLILATTWPPDPFWRGQPDVHVAEAIDDQDDSVGPVGPGLELQGIMNVGGERACVVSGRLLRVGDTVDGWTIVGIGEVDAQLTRAGQTLRLRLP